MKLIVTHKNPHLDEITCIWMIKKFLRGWDGAVVRYIPTNAHGGSTKKYSDGAGVMMIGVGRGKFDEHKGNLADSATTLVYKFIVKQGAKLTRPEKMALLELVGFVNDDDHGKHLTIPFASFHISACMAYLSKVGQITSGALAQFGLRYLDGVFAALQEHAQAEQDFAKGKIFTTPWGRAVAVTTRANAKEVVKVSAAHEIQIAVVVNSATGFKSIRSTPECGIDLTAAYEKMRAAEPGAEWYLHHSKKMLICGSDVAENKKLSRASLQTLMKLISV